MVEIREDIDNLPTLYRFDIVDFGNVSTEFRDAAMRHCEYINGGRGACPSRVPFYRPGNIGFAGVN